MIQKIIDIESAADAPGKDRVEYFEEPMVKGTLVFPREYIQDIKTLCEERRGIFIDETPY